MKERNRVCAENARLRCALEEQRQENHRLGIIASEMFSAIVEANEVFTPRCVKM